MIEVYLFDWGDTLMVDFPGIPGKMCDWEEVEAIDGARETLRCLSQTAQIYIATGAAESTESEIQRAFERVGLDQFITGYFCKANLSVSKGSPGFLEEIVARLGVPVSCIAMVGDSLTQDIEPALAIGIHPVWFSSSNKSNVPDNIRVIKEMKELCR